jgi:putative membrane protein
MADEEKRGVASERVNANDFRQELKLGDKLAIERTVLAADRTMLAGVRTSMAFIGFGFTIFNVLKYLQEHSTVRAIMRPHTPRNIGSVMLLAGVIPLFALIIQYSRTLKLMGRRESIFSNPIFQMTFTILLLGTILLITLIGDIIVL